MSETNAAPPKRQLKNYLISPKGQLFHATFTMLALIISMAIVCLVFLSQLTESFSTLAYCQEGIGEMQRMKDGIIRDFIFSMILLCVIYGILNIIITHRVFGALYAAEKYLLEVLSGGQPRPPTGRKRDQAKNILALVTQLGERYQELKKKNDN